MKKIGRYISFLLALVMLFTCFVGCGGKNIGNVAGGKENTSSDIKIWYWNSGFGSKWIEATVKRFNKLYPEYNVNLQLTASNAAMVAQLGQSDIDDTDIYFVNCPSNYRKYLEPLNDVLEIKAKGSDKKVGEYFRANWLENSKFADGNCYLLPAVGTVGYSMVYNKDIFNRYDLTVPRTTQEATVVADTLLAEKVPAFVSFQGAGYWQYAAYVWYAQYEGLDYALNTFFACKDPKTGESPSKSVFTAKDGRYEILKALEGMLDSKYILQGSNSLSHTLMQTYFVQGKAAMMYNGSWLENEAKSAGKMDHFGVFRLPLISTITNKLSTVKNEIDLRELISAVDSVIDGEKTENDYKSGTGYKVAGKNVSAADWKHILNARRTRYGNSIISGSFIPKYSTAKEGAKQFLAYMLSKENVNAVAEEQHFNFDGIDPQKVQINTSGWSDFAKEYYKIESSYTVGIAESNIADHRIFSEGGATLFAGVDFIPHFQTNNATDRWTAEEAWSKIQSNEIGRAHV